MKELKPNICVIGCMGFVGRAVYDCLLKSLQFDNVVGIGSQSPDCLLPFDVIINCAGVGSRINTARFYDKACFIEDTVLKRIEKMNYRRLIHVSSIDVELNPSFPYAQLKICMENKYKQLVQSSSCLVILRLGGIVGKGLKKNVVFDILTDSLIYITSDSVCNYISTYEVAKIVSLIITKKSLSGIINIAAKDSITVEEICHVLGRSPTQFGTEREHYIVNIDKLKTFFETKSSSYYIEEVRDLFNFGELNWKTE